MLLSEVDARPRKRTKLSVHLAQDAGEVREAQKLRWRVFAEEMGARLDAAEPGVDADLFDPWCEHLIVREQDNGEVIGTYRILTGARARRLGGFYSDEEFDLTRIDHLRDRTVEVGRSCVHPDHRNGATIALLWQGLAQFMQSHHYEFMVGCASISMADGGHGAASIYNRLRQASMSPIEYRAFPRYPLPLDRWTWSFRRSSRGTCAAARGSAATRRGILTSIRRICSCCCPCPGSTAGTHGTS
jgi:putative hemolysin